MAAGGVRYILTANEPAVPYYVAILILSTQQHPIKAINNSPKRPKLASWVGVGSRPLLRLLRCFAPRDFGKQQISVALSCSCLFCFLVAPPLFTQIGASTSASRKNPSSLYDVRSTATATASGLPCLLCACSIASCLKPFGIGRSLLFNALASPPPQNKTARPETKTSPDPDLSFI